MRYKSKTNPPSWSSRPCINIYSVLQVSTHKKSASLSILSGNYENIGQTYTFCFGFLFIFNTCTRYMDFILAKNMIPVFYHKLNFHLLLMWQYDVPTFWAIWNKTRASFDEVVYFCSLYCVSRMWINNGESVACRLFLVHVQTSIHRGDSRLTDRHVFMSGHVLLICYSCLFQKWIRISTRKTKKPPKCELCHYQFNRHKKFRVNYSFDFTIKICYRLTL